MQSESIFRRVLLAACLGSLCLTTYGYGLSEQAQGKSDLIALRLIGHKLLSCAGDDKSRVLPVLAQGDSYTIAFEDSLSIEPTDLEVIVDSVMTAYNVAQNYWVEVKGCIAGELLHTYQVGPDLGVMLPCRGRTLPRDCYKVVISLYRPADLAADEVHTVTRSYTKLLWFIPVVLSLFLIAARRRKEQPQPAPVPDPALLQIGDSLLDSRNLTLSHQEGATELSHKEAELLKMLHRNANVPVERQDLLSEVWGDQGDYVGRTLDVFISRLRKKLQADTSLKIVNIRGVGYKLIVGGS